MDDETLGAKLLPTLDRMLGDATQLDAMRTAARTLARPDPARALAQIVQEMATA